ncbi:MAG: hypothetical protein SV377_07155 [Halobacteria archaeon]|nr:hypothetical protein [Halobacteria archaeon]
MSETEISKEELEKITQRIEDLEKVADDLRELGRQNDIPAIERNAKRVQSVVEMLEANVPTELTGGQL